MTHTSKPAPAGWPRMSSAVFYDDPTTAIDWLCKAFGFDVRVRNEGDDGRVVHAMLQLGDGLIVLGDIHQDLDHPGRLPARSPRSLGGANTQALCFYVDDVDAHCAAARAAGATVLEGPETYDHGEEIWVDRTYRAVDLEGHHWFFMQRIRDGKPRA